MLAYVMLGSNNPEKAYQFYDPLLETAGIKSVFANPNGTKFYSGGRGQPMFAIGAPADGAEAGVGNGTMVAIPFEETDQIDAFYAKALDLGASDEGAPGWRMPGVFYGAYFRDPDGNKICACKMNMG